MNQVTQVNVLNGDVKFTYENGEQELLSARRAGEYLSNLRESYVLSIDFATPQRRLVYVANRYFN